MPGGADAGITTIPWSLSFAISSLFWGERERSDPTASDQQVDAVGSIGRIGAQVDPERLVGAPLHLDEYRA